MNVIKLTKDKTTEILKLSDNFFFVEIKNIDVTITPETKDIPLEDLSLKFIKSNRNTGETRSKYINIFDTTSKIINNEKEFEFSEIELELINKKEYNITVIIEIETIKKVFNFNIFNDFKVHLSSNINSKILFSAPFGQGKTTFIQEFFKENNEEYEVFHLFPVNYSIAQNSDIFEYIKCEILFQLLGKDVEFEKDDMPISLSLPQFARNNIETILINFANLIPNIGKDISNVLSNIIKLKDEFIKYNKELKIDDEAKAKAFIDNLFEKKGSLYEDNYITQIIRQLLEQFYKNKKQTVLVIDDLDRIDPEHIFRILNVFSAHFDTPYQKHLEISNKFGFDKVVLVCDYDNLYKIFIHKFGEGTDFTGYIDKFFSSEVFYYDNKKIIKRKIHFLSQRYKSSLIETLLNDLYKINELSLRELIKLENLDFDELLQNPPIGSEAYKFEQINALYSLIKIFDAESLVYKLNKCKNNIDIFKQYDYTELTKNCFLPLVYNPKTFIRKEIYEYTYKNIEYSFERQLSSNNFIMVYDFKYTDTENDVKGINFNYVDFYLLLIEIFTKYKTNLIVSVDN